MAIWCEYVNRRAKKGMASQKATLILELKWLEWKLTHNIICDVCTGENLYERESLRKEIEKTQEFIENCLVKEKNV